MLSCVSDVHVSQSGALLLLLLENFLRTHRLTVARRADMLACARIELLLSLDTQVDRRQ